MKINNILNVLLSVTILFLAACEDAADQSAPNGQGQGGSLARFTISNDHIYIVTNDELIPLNISDPWNPQRGDIIDLGRDIETIFPYKNHLFIGSMTGMHIYNIDNPEEPEYLSTYQHVRACDPVVVQDNFAYVTLRAANTCGGTQSVLDIVDVSRVSNPYLLNSIDMQSPYGLGIDANRLFVCEGSNGIQSFDASHPVNVKKDTLFGNHFAYDVILTNKDVMIVTGEDGIYQYSYKPSDNLKLLSHIKSSVPND